MFNIALYWKVPTARRTFSAAILFLATAFFTYIITYEAITPNLDMYHCSEYEERDLGPPTGCYEKVYNFDCTSRSDFVLGDWRLMDRCKARAFLEKGHPQLAHLEAQNKVLGDDRIDETFETLIRGKCDYLKAKLITFTQVRLPGAAEGSIAYKVPNVVHYIWFGSKNNFTFINYLSMLSSSRFLKPEKILIHGDQLPPSGVWWERVVREVPNMYFVSRERVRVIQGVEPRHIEHEADIVRLQTLYANGGIYLDLDVLVLRSFDTLRKHSLTLGQETEHGLSNGIILAEPHSPFICVWLNMYRHYQDHKGWNSLSVQWPYHIAQIMPDYVHVETDTLTRPNYMEAVAKFLDGHFNWTNNYAVHVWHRLNETNKRKIPQNMDDLKHGKGSLTDIIRYILGTQRNL